MKKQTIWFNKSLSSIVNVVEGLHSADTSNQLALIITHPEKDFQGLLACGSFYKEPSLTGAEYFAWALKFCTEHAIDVFVCGKQARYLAQFRSAFKYIGTKLLIATSAKNIEILDDKDLAYKAIREGGLGEIVPPYAVCATREEFEHGLTAMAGEGKLCFKPTVSVFGIGFRVITDEQSKTGLDRLLSGDATSISVKELGLLMAETPSFKPLMVMPYLEGNERSIDCLAHEGKLVTCVIRRKTARGQVLECNPVLTRFVERLVAIFRLDNFFNVQFRAKGGKYYLLEINPRLSGGTHYTFHSGLNLPYLGLMLKLGLISPTDIPEAITGLRIFPLERSVALPPSANSEGDL